MVTHELKLLPEYYSYVESMVKTFELRKNDRNYQIGDILLLREWDDEDGYTGKSLYRKITYIFVGDGTYGLREGYVILSLEPIV